MNTAPAYLQVWSGVCWPFHHRGGVIKLDSCRRWSPHHIFVASISSVISRGGAPCNRVGCDCSLRRDSPCKIMSKHSCLASLRWPLMLCRYRSELFSGEYFPSGVDYMAHLAAAPFTIACARLPAITLQGICSIRDIACKSFT